MKAINKNIIVEIDKELFKEQNGLIVHLSDRPITQGKVISIGPKCSADININDIIRFREHAGEEFEYNGKHYITLTELNIYGTIHETKEV